MGKLPVFSIVMPVYNREKLVKEAIESIVGQTFTNWELIVVDDGSTDHSAAVIKSVLDSRIQYHYQTNAERSAARNKGISLAKGEYVLFLDSDDYFLPNHLENVFQTLDGNSDFALITGLQIDNGNEITPRKEKAKEALLNAEDFLVNAFHSQQVCLPRHFLENTLYNPQIRIGEDTELWIRIFMKGYPFHFFPNIQSVVVREHEGRTINPKNNTAKEYRKTIRHIYEVNKNLNIKPSIKKEILASTYFSEAKSNMLLNNRFSAISNMIKAIYSNPGNSKLKFWINIIIRLVVIKPLDDVYRFSAK